MLGWITVWLLLGLMAAACKVELFLVGVDLDIAEARLGSGGWFTSSPAEEPWASVAWALCLWAWAL